MKVLHLALLTPSSPQQGQIDALTSIADEYVCVDWMRFNGDHKAMQERLIREAAELQPDIFFSQHQSNGVFTREVLDQIPGVKISWGGDVRSACPDYAFELAPSFHCTCFSNQRDVDQLRAAGHRSEFLNIGFSPNTFKPEGEKRPNTPPIVFLGNHYGDRFPASALRLEMCQQLEAKYRKFFAAYGSGWGPAVQWLNEEQEAAAYRSCKIAIDLNHYLDVDRFFSDRRLRIMASGAFCIANHNPGIENDFVVGEHLVTFKNIREIPGIIDYYMTHEDERKAIAAAGCEYVHRTQSWAARMPQLLAIADKYKDALNPPDIEFNSGAVDANVSSDPDLHVTGASGEPEPAAWLSQ
jgi:hypothetical protein